MNNLKVLLWIIIVCLCGCADNRPVVGQYPMTGKASWYTSKHTASGEKFKTYDFTCAMRRRDFGKYYKVCNIANSKCVVVRHNNFGPSKWLFEKGRIIDLSKKAFSEIADLKEGIVEVSLEEVKKEVIK